MMMDFAVQAAAEPQWYEGVAGVLAIPTAVLALIGAPILIRKANLESRRTKLEILEKEQALAAARPEVADAGNGSQKLFELVSTPLIESRRVQEIILRFILLFLALQGWNLAERILEFVPRGFAAFSLVTGESVALHIVVVVLQQLPQIGYYLIIVGLGGPLLMDTLDHFHLAPPWLAFLRRPGWLLYSAVAVVVLATGVANRFSGV